MDKERTREFSKKMLKIGVPLLALGLLVGFLTGWLLRPIFSSSSSGHATPLRLNSYKFIGPLLVCNTSDKDSPDLTSFAKKVNTLVNQEVKQNNVSAASVFFEDLNTNRRVVVNDTEKYYPASLGKIPIMIAYYKAAQTDPEILNKQLKFILNPGEDQNAQQEIAPSNPALPNTSYTAEQLIEKMIDYSDNNAAALLSQDIGLDAVNQIYDDFKLPHLDHVTADNLNFMTVNDFSFFFRALYNNSYLGDVYSEKALEVLSRTDFNAGLVAGIPKNTQISHKFGLTTISAANGDVTGRELNDCGIVYHPNTPYLICVMTKSNAGIPDIEGVIQRVSSLVWNEAGSNYK